MDTIDELIHHAKLNADADEAAGKSDATTWRAHWRRCIEVRAETERLRAVREAAIMAKTRLDDFADKANAGQVHYSARELKRKIWAAFADFDALEQGGSG